MASVFLALRDAALSRKISAMGSSQPAQSTNAASASVSAVTENSVRALAAKFESAALVSNTATYSFKAQKIAVGRNMSLVHNDNALLLDEPSAMPDLATADDGTIDAHKRLHVELANVLGHIRMNAPEKADPLLEPRPLVVEPLVSKACSDAEFRNATQKDSVLQACGPRTEPLPSCPTFASSQHSGSAKSVRSLLLPMEAFIFAKAAPPKAKGTPHPRQRVRAPPQGLVLKGRFPAKNKPRAASPDYLIPSSPLARKSTNIPSGSPRLRRKITTTGDLLSTPATTIPCVIGAEGKKLTLSQSVRMKAPSSLLQRKACKENGKATPSGARAPWRN